MEISKLKGVITIEGLPQADRGLRSLESRLQSTARTAESSAGKIAGSMKGLGSIMSGIGSVAGGNALTSVLTAIAGKMDETTKVGVDYFRTLENASVAFEKLTGSSASAAKHIAELQKLALTTPFEFEDVNKASLKLQAFGFSADQVIRDLPKLSDAASIAAAGTGDFKGALDGVILALGQMRAKGKVSLEEINQLTERGVPALEILAQKLGKTTAQTTRLIESGRVRGGPAVDALIEGFGERYGGTGDRLSKTLAGKESNYTDLFKTRAEVGAQAFVKAYNDRLDAALNNPNATATDMMATEATNKVLDTLAQIGKATTDFTPAKNLGQKVGTAIAEGLGIGTSGPEIEDAIAGTAASAILAFKKMLGIQSPSTVFKGLGELSAEGYAIGITEGFKKWAKQLEKNGGDEFIKAVEAMAKRLKTDPRFLLNVMAFESRLNPAQKNLNGSSGSGLIQFMDKTAVALGTTTDKLRGMNAIEQLKYVEAYFKQFRGFLDTQESVYTAVLAGHTVANPDITLFRNSKGKSGQNYRANAALDIDKSGGITAREAASFVYKQGFLSNATGAQIAKPLEQIAPMIPRIADALTKIAGGDGAAAKPLTMSLGNLGAIGSVQDPVAVITEIVGNLDPVPLQQYNGSLELNRDHINRLTAELAAMANPLEQVTAGTRNWKQEILGSNFAEELTAFGERTGAAIDQTLMELITGQQSLADAGKNLLKGVLNDFFSTMQQQIMQSLTGESSIGAYLGKLAGGLLSGLFGFGGARASGGPVSGGRSYLVGEQGPELVTMGGNGYVHNAAATKAMAGGHTFNISINAPDANTAALAGRSAQQGVMAALGQLERAGARR